MFLKASISESSYAGENSWRKLAWRNGMAGNIESAASSGGVSAENNGVGGGMALASAWRRSATWRWRRRGGSAVWRWWQSISGGSIRRNAMWRIVYPNLAAAQSVAWRGENRRNHAMA
jgi:hypothetical protein